MVFSSILKKDTSGEFYTFLDKFVNEVHSSIVALQDSVVYYVDGDIGASTKAGKKVIALEKSADEIRRSMERTLYSGVLVPFGREDKYALIETLDDLSDRAEIIIRLSKIKPPKIPAKMKTDLKLLMKLVVKTSEQLKAAILLLNTSLRSAINEASKVELKRETVRDLEFKLIEDILSQPSKNALNILLLKELISLIGQLADKAEEAADRVIMLAVKYQG